jgi:hypoxanthine phosphoribosyltransferase
VDRQLELASVCSNSVCVASASDVDQALDSMAADVMQSLTGAPPVLLCVMNGGLLVAAELLKRVSVDLTLDYIHATRYRDKTQGQHIEWRALPAKSLADRQVVVVDDIFDEGLTLSAIVDYCWEQGAAGVTAVVLVNKLHDRKVAGFVPEVVGLQLPDHYLYGFGMDYKGYLRNRSAIYAVVD